MGQVRAGVRALLSVRSDIPKRHWPSALRQFVAQRFELSMKELGGPPTKRQLVPFGTPVTVQSRNWSRKTPYASRATSGDLTFALLRISLGARLFFFLAKMLTAKSRGFMSLQFFIKESKTHWSFKQNKIPDDQPPASA